MRLLSERVSFSYTPSRPVLRGVTAAFLPGRVAAIIGPNGCGKSTFLRLLLGAVAPEEGRVMLGEECVHDLPATSRALRIAYVAQSPSVAEAFSVRQVIMMGRHALSPDEAAVTDSLDRMDLADRADDAFATLSAGQQQRAAVARALAQLWRKGASQRAGVLLADEPISALDPPHAISTMATLREVATEGSGVAVVVVLHDLSMARRFADDAVVLGGDGSVLASGVAGRVLTPATLERAFGIPFEVIGGPPPRPEAVVPLGRTAGIMTGG